MTETVDIITGVAILLFLYTAWSDFRFWKIPNAVVLALIALYALSAALKLTTAEQAGGALGQMMAQDTGATLFSSTGVGGDIGAGLLLFGLGFGLWSFKLFGAGDAKLFLPIGLFVGWHGMLPFAVFLLIGGIAVLLALRLPMPLQLAHLSFFMRIEEIRATRKIPYGVIMVFATIATLALRYGKA
ncbi:pilus assembly protein CpaA [Sinorhizobium terangae]|uniref:pilus assembly protein CpaA n=1 Tax=Sinorhizobium terangae TaxID=110322 RepID=UPI0024B0FCB1|nr:pilus assembly protein CpaA [Sinorhizobium terangae]WFU47174.1 pilus assembly protein CpaA [Sinorhizobium terangae]